MLEIKNISKTFSNKTFQRKKKQSESSSRENEDEQTDDIDSNVDPNLRQKPAEGKDKNKADLDEDGYMKFSIPWTFTVSYGVTMSENSSARINPKTMRYPYRFTQTLNFSGNVRLSDGWNINYSSGYDFNYHKLTMTTASLTRDLHCFSMSCSVVLKPYTSYNFSFRAKISTLADLLKWDKRSSYSSNIDWY